MQSAIKSASAWAEQGIDNKRRIANGRIDEVTGFDKKGNLKLKSGLVVSKNYGHLDHGFVVTSQTAQGKDAKKTIAAMGSESLPAINAKQLYVTASRGKQDLTIYVDDKQAIKRAIQGSGEQLSATELVKQLPEQSRRQRQSHTRQRQSVIERAQQWRQGRSGTLRLSAGKSMSTSLGSRQPATPQPGRSLS